MAETAHQIFISYSHYDRAHAEKLAALIQKEGYSVWWDHSLLAGEDFRAKITEKIQQAVMVFTLFSHKSVHSSWVLDEAGRANEAGKLIPILLDDSRIPIGFGTLHYLDMSEYKLDFASASAVIRSTIERFRCRTYPMQSSIVDENYELAESSGTSYLSEPHHGKNRFHINFLPDRKILSSLRFVLFFYAVSLPLIWIITAQNTYELVKLVHIYGGMVLFGGGMFLFLLFRLSDDIQVRSDRVSCHDIGRRILANWRIFAISQFVTGFLLLKLPVSNHIDAPWMIQSIMMYTLGFVLWWVGFDSALDAAKFDALYMNDSHIKTKTQQRDQLITLAIFFTAWTLILMVYKGQADITAIFRCFFKRETFD